MTKTTLALLAILMGLTITPAGAQTPKASTTAPAAAEPDTLILSDTLHYDDLKKESTFTGNVVLTRGAMTLRADTLVTHEDAQGYQFGTATASKGKLVHIRQDSPEKFEVLQASGLRAEYNGQTGDVEVIGQAIITRTVCGKPFDNIRGQRVIYHQKSNTYEAYGGAGSASPDGRVRSLAQPRSKVDQAMAECKAARP